MITIFSSLFLRVEGARKGSENGPLQKLVDGMIKYVVSTVRKRSCRKVMLSEVFVCPQEGCLSGGVSVMGPLPPPVTVEERAVRILLECILVHLVNLV